MTPMTEQAAVRRIINALLFHRAAFGVHR